LARVGALDPMKQTEGGGETNRRPGNRRLKQSWICVWWEYCLMDRELAMVAASNGRAPVRVSAGERGVYACGRGESHGR